MIIRRALCLSLWLFAASICVSAQCPRISVSSPSDVQDGEPITFTVNAAGISRNSYPTYNWTVSAGTISSGQGTSTITVDTTGAGGQSTTATVSLGGLDPRCNASASSTTFITRRASARKIDEYGLIRFADEKARLDNFAIELQSDPTARGYVIVYTSRSSAPRAATTSLNTIEVYLVNTRGIERSRIVTVDGGKQVVAKTELWIVPQGATPPGSAPVVERPQTRPAPSVARPQTPADHNGLGRRAG